MSDETARMRIHEGIDHGSGLVEFAHGDQFLDLGDEGPVLVADVNGGRDAKADRRGGSTRGAGTAASGGSLISMSSASA